MGNPAWSFLRLASTLNSCLFKPNEPLLQVCSRPWALGLVDVLELFAYDLTYELRHKLESLNV
jgi:hypothetical protein